MSSNLDMIDCPHNNTECILQAVVALLNEVREKNAEFNWDPLSFVFTAVTGVVAACFAGIAILQAFFAAGPGRLKASRYAIGPWARFTKRSFDWQEWRFRSVAQTPVIAFSSPNGVDFKLKYSITESPEYQPAGWNALLSRLSLDMPELWAKKPLGADHLPQELPAVPAYGNIAAIMTLAIAQAGGNCKLVPDQDSEFLMVRGDAFQLRLMKHAVLGTVATFETYPSTRITSNSGAGSALSQVYGHLHFQIRYSLGYVPLDFNGSDWMLLVEPEDCAPGAFMFPNSNMAPYQRQDQGDRILDFIRRGQAGQRQLAKPRCRTGLYQSPDCCGYYAESDNKKESKDDDLIPIKDIARLAFESRCPLGLMVGSPAVIDSESRIIPPIVSFPSQQAELHLKAQILVLQSRFWSRGAVAEVVPSTFTPTLLSGWQFPPGDEERLVNKSSDVKTPPPGGTFLFIREAYEQCLRFLETGATTTRSPSTDTQVCLATQLALIDRWLGHNAPGEKMCRQIALSTATTLMHNILRDETPLPPPPAALTGGTPQSGKRYPKVNDLAMPALHGKLLKIIRWFEWCCDKLGISFDNGTVMPGKFDLFLDEIRDRGKFTEDPAACFLRVKELLFDRDLIFRRLLCSKIVEMDNIQLGDFKAKLNETLAVVDEDPTSRASALLKLEDSKGTYSSLEDILHLLHKAIRIWELEPTQTFGGGQLAPTIMMGDNFVIPSTSLHPLDDLFIYRALLMATLLSLPVDTSPLLQNEMYQQMVPFL